MCGNGIVEGYGPDGTYGTDDDEICDDGNTENGDGCSADCTLESPLKVPDTFLTGSCIDNTLPVINVDEVLPVRWQTSYVSGALLNNGSSTCPSSLSSTNWILKESMSCDF